MRTIFQAPAPARVGTSAGVTGMDVQRWQRIAACFDELVELDATARAGALVRLGHDDAELRREVESLLRSDAALEDGAADPVAAPYFADAAADPAASAAGTLIGPWRVLHEIGRGGMGVVYLAERADGQFEQRAALKLMRATGDPAGLRRRFLRERQILAQLEHPHIARLLDGGVSTAGEPYFALEYIDGAPLGEYIAAHPADARLRLRLFLDICAAVQFAHRQLVVHCDIKPTNVLVNRDGAVKLLDFGIASVLGNATSSAVETQLRALTPAYASPEQLRGDPVTTAADIYALGAVLYEMLTGVRAYRVGLNASSAERLAALSDPRRALPSGALVAGADPPGKVRAPALEAIPLRSLRGDLDVITATALHADTEQRYATVEALADDVRRYLAGVPIAARASSARYRLGKFVGRHRVGVSLAAAAVVALLAAFATAVVQGQNARAQSLQAREAAHAALQQSERAEAVRRILVGVFEQAAPDGNDGRPITASELLQKGQRQIEGAIAAQPAVEADAATLIAELYVQIGDFARAEVLLQRALLASEDARVPDDVKARVLIGIAAIEDEKSEYVAALDRARRGLALLDPSAPSAPQTIAKAHYVIAHCLFSLGRGPEAESVLRESLARDSVALGENSDEVADVWVQLGNVYAADLRFAESESAFRKAIAALRMSYGEDSFHVAHVLNELSSMLSDKGDLRGAEAALRQSLAIRLRTVGPDHRDTLIVRHNLLTLLETEGRITEALPERLAVLDRIESTGRLHLRDLASYYFAAGRDQRDLGQFGGAEVTLRKAIAAFDASLGANGDATLSAKRSLGLTLALLGRYDAAEATLRDALALQLAREPQNPIRVAASRIELGNLLRLRHRVDDALGELRLAATVFDDPARSRHALHSSALAALAEAELASGDAAAAEQTATDALARARASLNPGHFQLAAPLLVLARTRLALGRPGDAQPLLEEALALRLAMQPAGDPRVLEIQVAKIQMLDALHRPDEQRALRAEVEPALRALRTPFGADLLARLPRLAAR